MVMVGQTRFIFFDLLISKSDWVNSRSDQPIVSWFRTGRMTRFDSSSRYYKSKQINFILL